MKKLIIVGIGIIACVALCAAVWSRSVEVGSLPAEPVKTAVTAEIGTRSEEPSDIPLSTDASAPTTEAVAESEPPIAEITTKIETQKATSTQAAQSVKPTPSSSESHMGDVRVVDGEKQVYLLGFGWIKDEGGGSVGTIVDNPGDELTGHKVSIMGGGTTVDGKGDINKTVGVMGSRDECTTSKPTAHPAEQPEISGDVIYTELQPPVSKDSTPPPYKPNGEPYNP